MTEHNLEERTANFVRLPTPSPSHSISCNGENKTPSNALGKDIYKVLQSLNEKDGWTVAEFCGKLCLSIKRKERVKQYIFAGIEEGSGAISDNFQDSKRYSGIALLEGNCQQIDSGAPDYTERHKEVADEITGILHEELYAKFEREARDGEERYRIIGGGSNES